MQRCRILCLCHTFSCKIVCISKQIFKVIMSAKGVFWPIYAFSHHIDIGNVVLLTAHIQHTVQHTHTHKNFTSRHQKYIQKQLEKRGKKYIKKICGTQKITFILGSLQRFPSIWQNETQLKCLLLHACKRLLVNYCPCLLDYLYSIVRRGICFNRLNGCYFQLECFYCCFVLVSFLSSWIYFRQWNYTRDELYAKHRHRHIHITIYVISTIRYGVLDVLMKMQWTKHDFCIPFNIQIYTIL